MRSIDFIAIHCSATPGDRDHTAADIRRWHRQRGFRDIGYHFVIRRDGTVERGRPLEQQGAHEPRINRNSVAVCLVGGSPPIGSDAYRRGLGENNFTDKQWDALEFLVAGIHARWPDAEVLGHRDVPGVRKACPSFDARKWWAGVLESGRLDFTSIKPIN